MTSRVLCVADDLGVDALTKMLVEENLNAAPVVDAARHPVGMISRLDLLRQRRPDATVAEVMTSLAFFVTARTSISQAAALMAFEDVLQVPVVSDDEKVIGLLTSLDVLRWLTRSEEAPKPRAQEKNEALHPWIAAMDVSAERMRDAFRWIESERAKQPDARLQELAEQARSRYRLSRAQASWLHWSLDPESLAVQPKEPTRNPEHR
jgi:predicted transcriptional regulator